MGAGESHRHKVKKMHGIKVLLLGGGGGGGGGGGTRIKVWRPKGILGFWDFTKKWCGIQDLTAPRK